MVEDPAAPPFVTTTEPPGAARRVAGLYKTVPTPRSQSSTQHFPISQIAETIDSTLPETSTIRSVD